MLYALIFLTAWNKANRNWFLETLFLQNIRLSLFLLSLVAFIVTICGAISSPEEFQGQCVKVLDGDTIDVVHESSIERVRLNGIDSPEKSQAWGRAAKQFTTSMVLGQPVTVSIVGHDRYGRTIGEVRLDDGRDLNQEIVRAGLAWWYHKYSNDFSLFQLEKTARHQHIGLWQDADPTPPWEYRHRHIGQAGNGTEAITHP